VWKNGVLTPKKSIFSVQISPIKFGASSRPAVNAKIDSMSSRNWLTNRRKNAARFLPAELQ